MSSSESSRSRSRKPPRPYSPVENLRIWRKDNVALVSNKTQEKTYPPRKKKKDKSELNEKNVENISFTSHTIPVIPSTINMDECHEPKIEINEEDFVREPPSPESTEGSDGSRRIRIPRPYSPQENLRIWRKKNDFRRMKKKEKRETLPGSKKTEKKCDVCGKCFSSKYKLEIHYRTHTGEKPFSCDTCDKSFAANYKLNWHKKTHTREKLFLCDSCVECFATKSELAKHAKIHAEEITFPCDICDKSFPTNGQLKSHKKIHPFSCDICAKQFNLKASLKSHMKIHERIDTGKKLFSCKSCKVSFTLRTNLVIHNKKHKLLEEELDEENIMSSLKSTRPRPSKPPRPYSPDENLRTWRPRVIGSESNQTQENVNPRRKKKKNKSEMNNKVVENTTSTTQNTDVSVLPSSGNLVDCGEEHIEINEEDRGSEPPSLEATEGSDRSRRIKIPRPYSPQENLRFWRDVKKPNKIKRCAECGKGFRNKSRLILHSSIHKRNKFISCDTCGKFFSRKSTLKTHMRLHTGEKPFSCDVCKKSFKDNSELTNHKCEILCKCKSCKRSFASVNHLSNHKCKNFYCVFCDKTFKNDNDLVNHRIIKECYFKKCEICKRNFQTIDFLNSHKLTEHNIYIENVSSVILTTDDSFLTSSNNFEDCGEAIKEEIKKEEDDIEEDPLSNHMEAGNVSNHEEIDIEEFKLEVNDDHSLKNLPKNSIGEYVDETEYSVGKMNQQEVNGISENNSDEVNINNISIEKEQAGNVEKKANNLKEPVDAVNIKVVDIVDIQSKTNDSPKSIDGSVMI